MRRILTTGTMLFLTLATPSVAEACSCGIVSRAGEQPPPWREWHARSRIFLGHALEVDNSAQQDPRQIVRFVVEASWRGAMPDTVTLRVGAHAACAWYIAGQRYFVFADVDPTSGALVTQPCDDSWAFNPSLAVRVQNALGPPRWTAPPVGRRSIDRRAVRLRQSLMREGTDTLLFFPPRGDDVVRFEIGNYVPSSSPWDPPILLSPGLYQFRITWTDGSSYASYLSMRCERPTLGRTCQVFRPLHLLRGLR